MWSITTTRLKSRRLVMSDRNISRRRFLLSTNALLGGLLIAESTTAGNVVNLLDFGSPLMIPENYSPTVWFTMQGGGETTIHVYRQELGQHIGTAYAQIVAEELEVDWEKVNVDYPVVDTKSIARTGRQGTGGSNSVRTSFEPLSQAACIARQFLVDAAAELMGAEPSDCYVSQGVVFDPLYGQKMSYAEILAQTSIEHEIAPEELAAAKLKDKSDYKVIGQPYQALDLPEKLNGKARFAIDARVPNMVYGKVSLGPTRLGSKVSQINDSVAREEVKGYLKTLRIVTSGFPGFDDGDDTDVGLVIAESFPSAMRAERSLDIKWEIPDENLISTQDLFADAKASIETSKSFQLLRVGNVEEVLQNAQKKLVSVYETNMIEHAALEPRSATVQEIDGVYHIYSSAHMPSMLVPGIARELGVSADQVTYHPHLIGGSFGDKIYSDQIVLAAKACKELGRPVKVMLTREDQFNLGHPKSISVQRFQAAISKDKNLAWSHKFEGLKHDLVAGKNAPFPMPTFIYADADQARPTESGLMPEEVGAGGAVNGAAHWYDLNHIAVNYFPHELMNRVVPVGAVRSVSNFYTVFGIESFFDEVAHELGVDPLDLRLAFLKGRGRNQGAPAYAKATDGNSVSMLRGPSQVTVDGGLRLANVLKIASGQANYGSSLNGPNVGQGISIAAAENRMNPSFSACVAEVAASDSGTIKVRKLTVCADVGVAINPDGIRSQIEGSLLWGLSSSLYEAATLEKGKIRETNFDAYKWQRNGDLPELDIHIVENGVHPTGIGESTLALAAPAICNAIYNLTGQRIRSLPISRHVQIS